MAAADPAKTATTEAFPVASLVLAAPIRAAVMAFYRFVRRADDIADDPGLPADVKLERLAAMEASLAGHDSGDPLAAALIDVDRRFGAGITQARLLLQAFRQDAVQSRYHGWDELLAYCRLSADPVGRFLLRLHGENEAADAPADALCTALQILNHLQDLKQDHDRLGRVYLPIAWFEPIGERRFFGGVDEPARRPVLDAALDQCDALLDRAACLPLHIRDGRLRLQAVATIASGRSLARRLRRQDPITTRVGLGALDKLSCLMGLALQPAPSDAAITQDIVQRSRTSFRFGIRNLSGDRRRALHAVYAFCRRVDDIADGAAPPAERLRFIDDWRREIDRLGGGAPCTPIGRELDLAVDRFALPVPELHLLLDGLALDAVERLRFDHEDQLTGYWRAVAGSVGLLSVRIFGTDQADSFALALARALQLVNILRDVVEDARRDRVYIPLYRLGGQDGDAALLIGSASFARAWHDLAEEAEQAFAEAERLLEGQCRRTLKPALLMLWSYRPLLARMRQRGWNLQAPRPTLRPAEKAWLAWLALREAA
ncbi:MAG TPA: squalene/phytoene synthase family protein [Geminicoccus sp.]|jgi:phytoene synthase|uniref:squalene/phytoene synthase family protein n=1 Tax=Geminicoccus sp. TaxID=2024832 RepID=UPI002E30A1D7|nr:squalene/phytoene synthase family protein [Geminicoccus sp.]HEX2528889.1 squalene/phytoene synthase family protein [Geminicoccus sp.]